MRAILFGWVVLAMACGGSDPAAALPLPPAAVPAAAQPSLVVPARHHRHHHRHWRRYSRGWEYAPSDAYPPAIEGQTGPAPAYPEAEAAPPTADRDSRAGTARPAIKWVNPDRRSR